jgi:hypothetical protein
LGLFKAGWRILRNRKASNLRKALTAGRFSANALDDDAERQRGRCQT